MSEQSNCNSPQRSSKGSKPKPVTTIQLEVKNTEVTESEQEAYSKLRDADLQKIIAFGLPAYPHKFSPNTNTYNTCDKIYTYIESTVGNFCQHYDGKISNSELLEANEFMTFLIGRIYLIRKASKKLIFIDLHQEGSKIQIMINASKYLNGYDHYDLITNVIRVGDMIGVAGFPTRTKTGELSLIPHRIELLAACKVMLPPRSYTDETTGQEVCGLTSQEIRFRQRYLDLMINESNLQVFIKRSKIIRAIRRFLDDDLELYEVTTPILNTSFGGATAEPFTTHSNDYKCDLFMRIAPELNLKQLIIGGFRGVYEIGQQFRNETNDRTHNAEFTSLELYIQNRDYNDLMKICETMLSTIVAKINGSLIIKYDGKEIDFTPPFKRFDMISTIEDEIKIKFPEDLSTNDARDFLDKTCIRFGVECSHPRTTPRLIDKLVEHFIEPKCINPSFITGHPQIMSPLAKWDRHGSCRTERFELFVNSTELANAYTELNDPTVQMELFKSQAKDKAMGDVEAMSIDCDFVHALKHGLVPTGGFGLGIDRFIMLLTGNTSIREVILFPTMKPSINRVA